MGIIDLLEYLIKVHGAAAAAAEVGGLSKEFKKLAVSQEEAGAAGATAGGKMGRFGGVSAFASKGVLALGAAAAAVGIESVKMANTFNTEMLKIRTEGGASTKEFRHMKTAVLDMAHSGASMGQGPTSLAMGLYHLESMGLRGRKALLALKLASQEAAISGSHLEDTTTAVGGALFVQAKGTGTLTHMMGTLNAIAGAGNMRFQGLNEALGTGLLGAAKIAGVSLQEMGASLAVLTDSGMAASSAGAQLATALHYLYAPTSKAQTALKGIGLSGNQLAADLHKPQGILAALKDLRGHMTGLSRIQQANVLNSILPGGRGRVLLNLYEMQNRLGPKYNQIQGTSGGFSKHVAEQQLNLQTRLAEANAKFAASMVKLGEVTSKWATPAIIKLTNAGAAVLDWTTKNLPEMVKLTRQGFGQLASVGRTVWHVLVDIGNACTTFGQWLIDGGKAIATFVTGGFTMFIKGWQQLLAVIQPVVSAIQTVTNLLPSIQMPSLPGGAATVTGHGTAAQRRQFNKAAGSLGIHTNAVTSGSRVPIGDSVVIHQHTGDFVVHVGGKEWGRITRREMQKAMMGGA